MDINSTLKQAAVSSMLFPIPFLLNVAVHKDLEQTKGMANSILN